MDEGKAALLIEDDARIPAHLPGTQWDNATAASGSGEAGRWYAALLAAMQELPEVTFAQALAAWSFWGMP